MTIILAFIVRAVSRAVLKADLLPSTRAFFRIRRPPFSELDHIILGMAGQEEHAGWSVGLIQFEVQVNAEPDNSDQLEEVDVQQMRLRSV